MGPTMSELPHLTMGKEAAPDQLEAPETVMAADDVRWRNGVNRQLRPDAAQQRSAASAAAAAKRKLGGGHDGQGAEGEATR